MMNETTTTDRRPRPGDLQTRASEVFVAPRVIDETAYTRYADDLKRTLERISREALSLTESTGEARSFIDELDSRKAQRKNEIESITKLLQATDAKAKRIDETIRKASEQLASLAQIEQTAQEVADRKAAEIEARIEKMMEQFETRLVDRAAEHEQRFLWAAHETEEVILERLAELRAQNDRAETVLGKPAAHPKDGPLAHDSLLDVLRRTEEGVTRLSDLRRRVAEHDYKARESIDALETTLETSIEQSRQIKQTHETLNDATDKALRASRQVETTLTSRADELADLSASLGSLVDRAGASTQTLEDVMNACDALHLMSQERYDELTSLCETTSGLIRHLEKWRPVLEPADELDGDLPPLPPVLRRIVEDFRAGLALDITRLADAVSSVANRDARPLDR